MPLRRFTDFILKGRLQALSVVFVCAFIPIVSSLCIIMTAFVTLRKGIFEGALITCVAVAPYVISYVAVPAPSHTLLPASVLLAVLLTSSVLVWAFALFLRRFTSWSITIELAGLIGIVLVMAVHLVQPDVQDWWASHIGDYLKQVSAAGEHAGRVKAVPQQVQAQVVERTKQYATGLMAVSILFNALLQLVLARWWQAKLYNPGGLRRELYQIRLSYVSVVIFLMGAVGSYVGNLFALDILPVLYAMFAMAGLSLAHYLASLTKLSWLVLSIVYGVMIVMFPEGVELIAIIGLFDTLLDFRARFARVI